MSDNIFFGFLLLTSLIFGTTMGAYFCTMEYRIRNDLPIITADCFCPSCGHRLPLIHQVPIISFLALHGQCHFCHTPIPFRYPITEGLFLLYYTLTYCLFFNSPIIYLVLWFLFICFLLTIKGHGHYSALIRGIMIITIYHAIISTLYLVLYLAVKDSFFL